MEVRMDGDTVVPDLTRYAALYIDIPNLLFRGDGGPRARLELADIRWRTLISRMLGTLETEHVACVGGLYLARNNSKRLGWEQEELRSALGRHRGSLDVVASTKDIDARLIIELFADLVGLAQELCRKRVGIRSEITVLLGGGDHVYAHAIERIRETLADQVDIRLHTFSWQANLSLALQEASNRIFPLDSLPIINKH